MRGISLQEVEQEIVREMIEEREKPLALRIEETYDARTTQEAIMNMAEQSMQDAELRVKLANKDEYVGAKNNEVRAVMMAEWLSSDEDYQEALEDYSIAARKAKRAELHAKRLRLLVDLARAGVGAEGGA
jgi:hypothetical protein